MEITYYEPDTGKIVALRHTSSDAVPEQEGLSMISGTWPAEQFYVVDGCPVRRPDMAIAVNGNVFSGLPIPATVRVGEESFDVTDGTAELTFMVPGPYRVDITVFPFQDVAFEVTAP